MQNKTYTVVSMLSSIAACQEHESKLATNLSCSMRNYNNPDPGLYLTPFLPLSSSSRRPGLQMFHTHNIAPCNISLSIPSLVADAAMPVTFSERNHTLKVQSAVLHTERKEELRRGEERSAFFSLIR